MSDELKAEFILGLDAVDFAKSDVGRYIIGRLKQDRDDAVDRLKTVFPWRWRKIQELQNQIWRTETVEKYLGELIINGKNAERILDDGQGEV